VEGAGRVGGGSGKGRDLVSACPARARARARARTRTGSRAGAASAGALLRQDGDSSREGNWEGRAWRQAAQLGVAVASGQEIMKAQT
jgi:hypothetical protein